jgi:hypothetical protein
VEQSHSTGHPDVATAAVDGATAPTVAWLDVDRSAGAGARLEKGTAPGEASRWERTAPAAESRRERRRGRHLDGNDAGEDDRTRSRGWSDGVNARAKRGTMAAAGLGAVAAIQERRRSGCV